MEGQQHSRDTEYKYDINFVIYEYKPFNVVEEIRKDVVVEDVVIEDVVVGDVVVGDVGIISEFVCKLFVKPQVQL